MKKSGTMFVLLLLAICLFGEYSSLERSVVNGFAYLNDTGDHTGIKVKFIADPSTPTAVTDSTYTDSSGSYSLNITAGSYTAYFTKYEYLETCYSFFVTTGTTLPDQFLTYIGPMIYIGGALSGVLTSDCPYIVESNLSINGSLVIQPGVELYFRDGIGFTVNGPLTAIGTSELPILFSATPGSQRGDIIVSNQGVMEYCEFTNATNGVILTSFGGTFNNNKVYDCLTGIVANRWGTCDNIEIYGCSENAILFGMPGDVSNDGTVFTNSYIHDNTVSGNLLHNAGAWNDADGAICIYSSSIVNNVSTGCLIWSGPQVRTILSGNHIANNNVTGDLIYLEGHSYGIGISNNIVENNTCGSLIYYYASIFPGVGIDNNIFINNHGSINVQNNQGFSFSRNQFFSNYGTINLTNNWGGIPNIEFNSIVGNEGNGLVVNGNFSIKNNLIAFNTGTELVYNSSYAQCRYNLIFDDSGTIINNNGTLTLLLDLIAANVNNTPCDVYYNISCDPLLSNGSIVLLSSSPCINAGDPNSQIDPDGSIVDIGAISFNINTPAVNLPVSFTFEEDTNLSIDMNLYVTALVSDSLAISIPFSQNVFCSVEGFLVNLSARENWYGTELITITIINEVSMATTWATTEIIVTPGNDAPTLVLPDSFTFEEDGSLLIDIALYSSDIDADPLTLSVTNNQNITAQISGVNVTLGALPNWNGSEQITITVNDNMGRAIASDVASIIVTPVNDAPTINLPASLTFEEDGILEVDLSQYVGDVDNDNLTLSASGNQNIAINISGMSFTLSAPANWNGTELVTFTVDDNLTMLARNNRRALATDTVDIIVTPGNDAPTIDIPDSFTFEEDGSLLIDIALYSSDIDGNPLTLSVTGNQNITAQISGLTATLGALPNWNGSEQMTLTVNDNMGRAVASDVASIIVTPVNDAPTINLPASFTFVEDGILEVDLSQYAGDVDNDNLTLSASGNQNIAINISGLSVIMSAPANWNGTELVTFTVDDNLTMLARNDRRALATDTVEIIVTPGNDAPTLVLPDSFTFEEDGSLLIDIALYSSDIDADPLTLSVTNNQNITAQISGVNVTLGALPNWNGSEQITITVNDNMGRAIASDVASIIVTPVNDAPMIVSYLPNQTQIDAQIGDIIIFTIVPSDIDSNVSLSWFVNDVDQGISTNEFSHQFTQPGTYIVKATIADENFSIDQIWTVTLPVANVDDTMPPTVTQLYQNYPNPFNPTTSIRFSVKESGFVSIAVFDIKGRLVRQVINQYLAAGTYTDVWNGMDINNKPASTGIYLIKMKTPDSLDIVKACMVK